MELVMTLNSFHQVLLFSRVTFHLWNLDNSWQKMEILLTVSSDTRNKKSRKLSVFYSELKLFEVNSAAIHNRFDFIICLSFNQETYWFVCHLEVHRQNGSISVQSTTFI